MRRLAAVALLSVASCYRYTDVAFNRVEPGREVRLHLSETGSARYSAQLGNGQSASPTNREVDGEVVAASDSQLVLAVRVPGLAGGYSPLRQRVTITPPDVSLVRLRTLDGKKMTVIGVASGVAVVALFAHYFGGVFGGNTEPRPGPGSELIFR